MKYTIEGFSQEYACTLRKQVNRKGKMVNVQIDCTDLVILRWFVDFYPSMKKHIVNNKEYVWLTHNKLMEDLPLIGISRQSFIDRMQKLVDFNILEYFLDKLNGNKSLYCFGENYPCMVNSTTLIGSTQQGLLVQPNNDKSISNKSLKDNIKENKKKDIFGDFNFTEKIKQGITKWLDYKKQKGQTYKEIGLNTLLKNINKGYLAYGEQVVIDSIDNCIANNYTGLFINKPNFYYSTRKQDSKDMVIKQDYSQEEIKSVFRNVKDIDLENLDI